MQGLRDYSSQMEPLRKTQATAYDLYPVATKRKNTEHYNEKTRIDLYDRWRQDERTRCP